MLMLSNTSDFEDLQDPISPEVSRKRKRRTTASTADTPSKNAKVSEKTARRESAPARGSAQASSSSRTTRKTVTSKLSQRSLLEYTSSVPSNKTAIAVHTTSKHMKANGCSRKTSGGDGGLGKDTHRKTTSISTSATSKPTTSSKILTSHGWDDDQLLLHLMDDDILDSDVEDIFKPTQSGPAVQQSKKTSSNQAIISLVSSDDDCIDPIISNPKSASPLSQSASQQESLKRWILPSSQKSNPSKLGGGGVGGVRQMTQERQKNVETELWVDKYFPACE
ncbi:hypothetical protein HDV05_008658, partial [Chytridiales sp. JEL 0842]